MLPASDIRFLHSVVLRLSERRLHVYVPGAHRGAVAVVFRFGDEAQKTLSALLRGFAAEHAGRRDPLGQRWHADGFASDAAKRGTLSQFVAGSHTATVDFGAPRLDAARAVERLTHHVDADLPSSLQLLFVRRAKTSTDRWSGHISFPGGLRDPTDGDDAHTVSREVYAMLGIPLDSSEFLFLGRLPDYHMRSRVVSAKGLVQSRFLFLHLGEMTPSVTLAHHEVDSVRWVPLDRLQRQYVLPNSVVHPLMGFLRPTDVDLRWALTACCSGALIGFPSVSVSTAPAAGAATGEGRSSPSWRVWGLTLRSTSELLVLDDRPALDWPLFSSNSWLLQHLCIDAFHGYYELQWLWYRACAWVRFSALCRGRGVSSALSSEQQRRLSQRCRDYHYGGLLQRRRAILPLSASSLLYAVPEHVRGEHLGFLLLDVGVAVGLLYALAASVYAVFEVLRVAVGLEDAGPKTKAAAERRRRYYAEQVPVSVERERRRAREQRALAEAHGEGESGVGRRSGEAKDETATDAAISRVVRAANGVGADGTVERTMGVRVRGGEAGTVGETTASAVVSAPEESTGGSGSRAVTGERKEAVPSLSPSPAADGSDTGVEEERLHEGWRNNGRRHEAAPVEDASASQPAPLPVSEEEGEHVVTAAPAVVPPAVPAGEAVTECSPEAIVDEIMQRYRRD